MQPRVNEDLINFCCLLIKNCQVSGGTFANFVKERKTT